MYKSKRGEVLRRKKSNSFNLATVIIIAIFICAILGILYFTFIKSTYINYGILLEKRVKTNSIDLKLGYDTKIKWVKISKKTGVPVGIAYNVRLKGIFVKSIEPCKVYTGKVLARSNKSIELDNTILYIKKKVFYYKIMDGKLIEMNANSIIIGSSKSKFIGDNNSIAAVIIYPSEIKSIRVGISNFNFSSLNHSKIMLHSLKGLIVKYNNGNSLLVKSGYLGVSYKNGLMEISAYSKSNGVISLKSIISLTNKRTYIYSASDDPIYMDSLKRVGYNYIPKYYGNFEVFVNNGSIKIINEVDIENYLRYVVPSEMLLSGGVEGYQVQAVAARTYVLSDMFSGRFAKLGFHVDDTTLSQVYNSLPSNVFCDEAIKSTNGEVLTYNKKIIDAKYYSTSCGVGAPFNEVWYPSKGPLNINIEPYLTFNNYSNLRIANLSVNSDAANFLKDWTIKSYDSNSPYFRWKFTLDFKNVSTIINKNIYKAFNKNPDNFKKKWILGFYKNVKVSKDGIGKISDIYISKRGQAGNVMELTIVTDTGTYKIEKELNIKRLLISKDIQITSLYGNILKNTTLLPSGFFVIDKEISNKKIKNITIYGGGFGHGVGMSQYGTIGLVRLGKSYKDILNVFYKNVKIDNYENAIKNNF